MYNFHTFRSLLAKPRFCQNLLKRYSAIKEAQINSNSIVINNAHKSFFKRLYIQSRKTIDHTMKGLFEGYKDARYYFQSSKTQLKPIESLRRAQVRTELLKFIPYSILVIIPFGELLLLPYIWLFPSMVPRYFLRTATLLENEAKIQRAQAIAFKRLRFHLNSQLDSSFKSAILSSYNDNISFMDTQILTHLNDNWPKYRERLGASAFNLSLSTSGLDFFRVKYVSGTYIVNQLLNIHTTLINMLFYLIRSSRRLARKEYQFNFWPLSRLRTSFLLWQLKRHIDKLQAIRVAFGDNVQNELSKLTDLESSKLMGESGIISHTRKNAEAQYCSLSMKGGYSDPFTFFWMQVARQEYSNARLLAQKKSYSNDPNFNLAFSHK